MPEAYGLQCLRLKNFKIYSGTLSDYCVPNEFASVGNILRKTFKNTGRPLRVFTVFTRRLIIGTLLLAAVTVISGCAGTAKGVDTSVYSRLQPEPVAKQQSSNAAAMVVIRYPAMIHEHAENLFVSSFAINAIGGEVPLATAKAQTSRIAQSLVEKSSYYAMTLYRELKKVLPENSVLLSPHIIAWDKQRQLHSRPILASEQIPTVLTIDFNIYSFPDVTRMMDSPPITFGDLVTPLIVVKSSRWIQPSLGGLLVSSPPLKNAAWRQVMDDSVRHIEARMEGDTRAEVTSLGFVSFLAERDMGSPGLPSKSMGNGNQRLSAVEQYPLEKIQMDGMVIAGLEGNFSVDPFERGFVNGASTRIVEILNSIDHDRATFFARQAALDRFDAELAKVFFIQSSDESVRARLQLAEALVGAEKEFLAAQSDSIYDGTYTGDYGLKMRKIISAEYRMLEERRRLARKQNITTAVAVIALAGSVYGAVASTAASTAAVVAASGAAMAGSVWALHKSLGTRTESEEVGRYFLTRMAPTFDRQMAVQMEWLESKEVITARGFAEFRNKTLSLYQARVRSMTVSIDQRCQFKHPEISGAGRWYGACSNGWAAGRGYGLISNTHGDTLEFLGYTSAGLASGSGGMIINRRGQLGATYYEGTFSNGLPNGMIRVERPGATPAMREFRAGKDIGKGQPGQLKKLSFTSGLSSTRLLNP